MHTWWTTGHPIKTLQSAEMCAFHMVPYDDFDLQKSFKWCGLVPLMLAFQLGTHILDHIGDKHLDWLFKKSKTKKRSMHGFANPPTYDHNRNNDSSNPITSIEFAN